MQWAPHNIWTYNATRRTRECGVLSICGTVVCAALAEWEVADLIPDDQQLFTPSACVEMQYLPVWPLVLFFSRYLYFTLKSCCSFPWAMLHSCAVCCFEPKYFFRKLATGHEAFKDVVISWSAFLSLESAINESQQSWCLWNVLDDQDLGKSLIFDQFFTPFVKSESIVNG